MWHSGGISPDHPCKRQYDLQGGEGKVFVWKTVPKSPVPASAPLGLWSWGLLPLAMTQPMRLSPWVAKLKFHSNHFSLLGEK